MALRQDLKAVMTAGVPLVEGRVFPLTMPQDTKKNSIVYAIVGDLENTGLCGVKVTSMVAVQVDVFAQTYGESVNIMNEAVAALHGSFNVANLSTYEMYEDITLKYRQIIDFQLKSYVDE